MRAAVITIFVTFASLAGATEGEPVSFKAWKDQQVIEAQNQLARLSNRLTLVKAGKIKASEIAAELNNESQNQADKSPTSKEAEMAVESSRVQKIAATDVVARLERDQERAQKNLDFAKEVTIEDYFVVYLSQFQDNIEALQSVASKLSKDEVLVLLKSLLKNSSGATSADHNSSGFNSRRKPATRIEASAVPHL